MVRVKKNKMNKDSDSPYYIKKHNISEDDISGAVKIHRREISQGFLSSLGYNPLHMFFSFIRVSRYGILHVAKTTVNYETVGFALGTLNTAAFYKEFLIKRSIKAFIHLAPKLISFEKMRKIVETLVYPSKNQFLEMPKAELLDIAIFSEHQGSGLAQLLFQAFTDTLRDRRIDEFKITTGERLTRAQRFYERLGAEKAGEVEVHKGQKTFVYIYKI